MWTLPKYAKACFIYPAWEGVDFNFENTDPYANSEFFDSDSSQHTPYFAFNLIQRFRRNSTTESSSYTHQFSKFDVRHPIVVKNFHIWYNEDDQTFKTNSDKSYNFGATLCPNNLPGVPHKAQKRIKIIKRHNQTIKY
ncbi:hypothetical protein TVAG_044790 [Trichomonas vaginalis G3]|uniref:Uncharacterized protein n=1 Tax=Trichomonas vaginalis (strain ATCC PRA-98 / G3) TaxID=412133 RepID=A2E8C7_TRIV3|nr:hypothetical protein TVAGG3_0551240 [Trichomonas vaginalis G3]EAY11055.1 hypothetical protein TVAG_044790 [Trichomonas vaginalis G3]KAI5520523.1 hypothetical protein TVAGG3_0551240 [Trichomonas vaginalis G3]|eukprot:XP_001323278.1 hypothetical protein [Trichomonas vaginalis G3]